MYNPSWDTAVEIDRINDIGEEDQLFIPFFEMNSNENQIRVKKELDILIGRIAGLSDVVLKEQCQEEYNELNEKLQIAIQQDYHIDMKIMSSSKEPQRYHGNVFILEHDLVTALEKNSGVELREIINLAHLRIPKDINDRHTLIRMCKHIDISIEVKDLSGEVVHVFNEAASNNITNGKPLTIFIYMLQEYEVFNENHNKFAIKL